MTQPGWYADPAGSGGIRWWDGSQWTEHVQSAVPQAPTVLDKRVLGSRLYADSRIISYGGDSVEVATVHWVAYSAAELQMRAGLFELGGTAPVSAEWRFSAGHYPFRKTPSVHMFFSSEGLQHVPEEWAFLVNVSQTHTERGADPATVRHPHAALTRHCRSCRTHANTAPATASGAAASVRNTVPATER